MKYFAYTFECNPVKPLTEILIAELAEAGFESFEENERGCVAYIPDDLHKNVDVNGIVSRLEEIGEIAFTVLEIPDQNWNATWEAAYPVVTIDDKCIVRAPFHEVESQNYDLDIIIQPQMSFGTGHHETTYLVLSLLLQMDVSNKTVLDMGSGTGVLAIGAKKLGAKHVLAIDNEEWAYKNTLENVKLNNVDIIVKNADALPQNSTGYDIILANINKNVLIHLMPAFGEHLKDRGVIVMSGFFNTDAKTIQAEAATHNLILQQSEEKNNWCALKFVKK